MAHLVEAKSWDGGWVDGWMGGWSGGRPASGDFPDDAVPFDVFRMRAVGWVGGTGWVREVVGVHAG